MRAVISKLFADVRRRKLQTVVIMLVVLLSSGAATLALSLIVESDAPYDRAFQRANGPHLVLTFDAHRTSKSRLRQTAVARVVTAAAGPWPVVETAMVPVVRNQGRAGGPAPFSPTLDAVVVGRSNPRPAVDRITIESGTWARSLGGLDVSRSAADQLGLSVGQTVRFPDAPGRPTFRVVGIADSISPVASVWMPPESVRRLAGPHSPLEYQMAYRVRQFSTGAELRADTQAIASRLAAGTLLSSSDYLQVKQAADIISAVMIPFLLSFSLFALAAATLIVANVVSGVVVGSYREIGVMKSVGFTPRQITWEILGQVLAPAIIGSVVGITVGTLASRPFLESTAHALGLPAATTVVGPVDGLVLSLIMGVCLMAGLVPALRAGRLTAMAAITMGTAPGAQGGSTLGRLLSQSPLPRTVSLGLEQAISRPLRSLMTTGSIVVGVATLVFALSLHLSLGQVAAHLDRSSYAQLEFGFPTVPIGAKLKSGFALPPQPSRSRVAHVFSTNPSVARFVDEAQSSVLASGIAEPIQYYAYQGASRWLGYAIISGRWFERPGEVVAPTRMLTQAHLHVGGTVFVRMGARSRRLHIVGEILDQTGNDLLLRGSWTTLRSIDPTSRINSYELQVRQGSDPSAVAQALAQTLEPNGPNAFNIDVRGTSTDGAFILFNGVIAALALILISIAAAGVFNTVILATREKARDLAVLKAVGMAPFQVVAMVLSSTAILGLIAGPFGIPAGQELHRQVIQLMGRAASGTRIPPSFFNLIDRRGLALLALSGVLIAVLGAWPPSQWAASKRAGEVLQSE
ncbi:MAG TPA: ABC transporter permease [Chloroflexota bacterium]|nr:ABC transporter permease [Chloroflexota bacterium]